MENIIDRTKWFFHPIVVFVFSIVALAMSLILYIYWYMEVSAGLREVVVNHNLDPSQFFELKTWVVILILSILVGIILVGIFIIFVYNLKTSQLYRLQKSFINNFTHELKTPVTSLKLYLETFLKHELTRSDQVKYLGYMIKDVGRLSENINHILDLAKFESRSYAKELVITDLVQEVERFCQNNAQLFGTCEINVCNLTGRVFSYPINPFLFEMLLMNLLTNAVKYNDSEVPRVDITFELGKKKLHLRFKDNGIGIEKPK